jgi:hypothetical protein
MAFAYFDNDKWNEITGDFTLGEDSYTLEDVISSSEEALDDLGIKVIQEPTESFKGARGERHIEDQEGVPFWKYEILPEIDPLEDARKAAELAAAKQAIENRIQQAFNRGYLVDPVKYPDFIGERLQCRDDSDRTNWLVAEKEYVKAVDAGAGAIKSAEFRVMSNKTIKATFDDAVSILSDLTAWGFIIMKRGWALKDALAAGDEYDLEAGWPA